MATASTPNRRSASSKARMTPSEAFVEVLVANGVTDVLGIIGSANMDALDIFPASGIRYVPTAHEQGAGHAAGRLQGADGGQDHRARDDDHP